MKTVKKGLLAAAMTAGMLTAMPADAATFLFSFSGTPFGNTASATGSFDIADSALASVNANATPAYGNVSNLTMTVSNAGAGSGAFTTGNFVSFFFRSPIALDFTRQLVGQPLGGGATFGQLNQAGLAGDFTFFSYFTHAPTATSTFTLGADRGLAPRMALTSLIATNAVPEPASWAMLILGVGLIGFAIRRQRRGPRTAYAG